MTLHTLILRPLNERTSKLQMKILVDYSVSWIQQEFIPHFDMQNSWYQYWLRKKCCPGRANSSSQQQNSAWSRSWHCPGEKPQLWTQFWVLPTCHCSAAATREWRSDKQVKNSLKNRDKNIPTRVKCGINITNTILCVPVPGQVWRSCLSGRKNEAEV